MKREVVRDFLNLPGIVGIALIDGRSRPFFLGIDRILNFQQKEALSQGIQQVVETTPATFEFFEFQFSNHRVYIYKLEQNIILLVLTSDDLVYANYMPLVSLLRLEIQDDLSNAIANFRLAAGNITLSGQSYWKRSSETVSSDEDNTESELPPQPDSSSPRAQPTPHPNTPSHETNGHQPQIPTTSPTPPHPAASPHPPTSLTSESASHQFAKKDAQTVPSSIKTGNTADTETSSQQASFKEVLAALNHLSKTTTHYLGSTIVSNYWKSSRPAIEWLSYFEVDRSGQITFSGPMTPKMPQELSPEQHQWLREWVDAFVQRCSRVIRDFPSVIQKMELNPKQRSLLLPDNH